MSDQNKLVWLLKYGHYLPYRLDIDLTTVNKDDRVISSMNNPNGIYTNIAEFVETEYGIPIELYCEQTGRDLQTCIWGSNL